MPQKFWKWNDKLIPHEEMRDYAKLFPTDFPYSPAMLDIMFQRDERGFASPTMLSGCVRQLVLKLNTDYGEKPEHAWTRARGKAWHDWLQHEKLPRGSIVERRYEIEIQLDDGRSIEFSGQPDLLIPLADGTWLLVDYKTVKDLENSGKASWQLQMSCYKWLLSKYGIEVSRIFIQQISMKANMRTEIIPLSDVEIENYIHDRIIKVADALDGVYNMENLPPMLDAALDKDLIWLCGSHNWCPVRELCFNLHNKEIGAVGTPLLPPMLEVVNMEIPGEMVMPDLPTEIMEILDSLPLPLMDI